jgi:pimeloyl-ACP methyl ester carboxylesterase
VFNGLPHLSTGTGPPVVLLLYLPHAVAPTGASRRSILRMIRPIAAGRTVHVLNRPPGLPASSTMADLADVYAAGLRTEFSAPVDIIGISTGGVLAQQLAADHPEVVERLILAGTAFRLGPIGLRAQREFVRRARAGRRPSPPLAEVVTGSPVLLPVLAAVMWLADGAGRDFSDAATMIAAENEADLEGRLSDITAPTLVLQGSADRGYTADLARRTAEGIADARLLLYEGVGHAGLFTDSRFARDILGFLAG